MAHNVLVAAPTISVGLEIRGSLEGIPCRVQMAGCAREIVRWTRKQPTDLLILDTSLPDMEGQKLIPLLREIDPRLPIIVTTANHSPALEQEVRASWVAFYAIRPDDLPHLGEVVRKNLSGESGNQRNAGGRGGK